MCLDGTRLELLEEIRAWSDDPQGTCIFWLMGMAGTGKSTVARTVARRLGDQKRLGASFFFSRGQGDRGHAVKFFPTLAFELATSVPALKPILRKAILAMSGIETKSLSYQWKHLLYHPLKELNDTKSHQQAIHIVVDALDECENEKDVQAILKLITEVQDLESIHLTIFLTSRPEVPVRTGFRYMPRTTYRDLILHEIPRDVVQADIRLYLRKEMDRIRENFEILEDWPEETSITKLVDKAHGLFIHASTVCSFVGDPDDPDGPEELLGLILSRETAGTSPFQALDDIYTQVLENSTAKMKGEERRERLGQNFRDVVGAIVILSDSLSADGLGDLLGIGKAKVMMTLRFLHSLLHIPKDEKCAIRPLHPSFRDFLLDGGRCREEIFRIDHEDAHLKIAENCVTLMSHSLRKNICNLASEWTRAKDVERECLDAALPPQLRYACLHWSYHLREAGQAREQSNCLEDNKQLHTFLQLHLLHWYETLTLLGKANMAWPIIATLLLMNDVSRNLSCGLMLIAEVTCL